MTFRSGPKISLYFMFALGAATPGLAQPTQTATKGQAPASRAASVTQGAAQALVDRARELDREGKYDEAIKALDAIAAKYGASRDPALLAVAAHAAYGKGSVLRHRGQNDEALAVFGQVVARYGKASSLDQRKWVVWSLIQKGEILAGLNRSADALSTYNDAIARAGNDPGLAKEAAIARYDKGMDLVRLRENDRASAAMDEIVARYGSSGTPELQEPVVLAFDAKAIALEQAGRETEAIAAYDAAISRYGSSTNAAVRVAIARTLVDKGITLSASQDVDGALSAYEEVIRRFGSDKEPNLKQWLANAYLNRGVVLASINHYPQARVSFSEVVRRFEGAGEPELKEAVTKAEGALRQLDQLGGTAGSAGPAQPVAPVPTLDMAMAASPSDLARSYLAMNHMILAVRLASEGMTSITPEGKITKENASTWKSVFEARSSVYRQAMQRRGSANFAGAYSFSSATPSCAKAQSYFAFMIADERSGRQLTITQSGFELKLKFGANKLDTPDAYAVEDSLAFSDPMNMDYVHLGELKGDQLVIRPQPEVLHSWPDVEGRPNAQDIRSCAIVLTRQRS